MKTKDTHLTIEERFEALLISTELANRLMGKRVPGQIAYEESEQGDARRRLLHVEKMTLRKKVSDAKAHAARVEAVSGELNKRIETVLQPQFADGHHVATKIIGFSDEVTQLLDVLSTRACSISRLEPILHALPWLQDILLKTVSGPEFKRLDSNGNPIAIESVRAALGVIGIENLRLFLPFFVFRHASPQITDPFPQIKNKLASYYLGIANGARRLAKLHGLPEMEAYTLGLFSGLGTCAAIRQYFREFDKTLSSFAKEAEDNKDQSTYQALRLVQPSPVQLTALHQTYSTELTTRVLEYMVFKRLRLLQAWADKGHPVHKILDTAQRYAQLKLLMRYRLVDKEEAKIHLSNSPIDKADLNQLNQPNLFKLAIDLELT